ncbi:hypothetical protein G7Y79_00034g069330 [Physcia stellaris]|nr:hypothetical protein G7Y79_00034g069330 [Physcia stellaris]
MSEPETTPSDSPLILFGAHIAIARIISLHTQPLASVDITLTPSTKAWTDLDDQFTEIEALLGEDEARDDDDPRKIEEARLLELLSVLFEVGLDLEGLANRLQMQVLGEGIGESGGTEDEGVEAMVEGERERCERLLRGVAEEFGQQGRLASMDEL